jgi:hypothetical protein
MTDKQLEEAALDQWLNNTTRPKRGADAYTLGFAQGADYQLKRDNQERDRYKEALEDILEKYQSVGRIYDLGAIAKKALEGGE